MNEILNVVQDGNIISIKNRLYGHQNIVYDGLINYFNFKCQGLNQTKNYNRLKLTLHPFDLNLTYIMIKIDKPIYFLSRIRTQFIATSNNNEIIWYKYEGPLIGGGQNYLFIYGKKIKLSTWFTMSNDDRVNLINQLT